MTMDLPWSAVQIAPRGIPAANAIPPTQPFTTVERRVLRFHCNPDLLVLLTEGDATGVRNGARGVGLLFGKI